MNKTQSLSLRCSHPQKSNLIFVLTLGEVLNPFDSPGKAMNFLL